MKWARYVVIHVWMKCSVNHTRTLANVVCSSFFFFAHILWTNIIIFLIFVFASSTNCCVHAVEKEMHRMSSEAIYYYYNMIDDRACVSLLSLNVLNWWIYWITVKKQYFWQYITCASEPARTHARTPNTRRIDNFNEILNVDAKNGPLIGWCVDLCYF